MVGHEENPFKDGEEPPGRLEGRQRRPAKSVPTDREIIRDILLTTIQTIKVKCRAELIDLVGIPDDTSNDDPLSEDSTDDLFDELMNGDFYIVGLRPQVLDDETIVRRIERGCFNATIESCKRDGIDRLFSEPKFKSRYSATIAKILSNLDPEMTPHVERLFVQIAYGNIDPNNLAQMTSVELCPEVSEKIRFDLQQRLDQTIARKVSRQFTCRRCGKNETVFEEQHTRATDEESGKSIQCVHCQKVWKQ